MIVEHGNVSARISAATPKERRWLREYLSFRTGRRGDQVTRVLNDVADTFPAGFVPMIAKHALAAGIRMELLDRRAIPCPPDLTADLGWLRDYQLGAVDAAVVSARGIWRVPTGGGKTESAVGLSLRVPCRWLFLVHRFGLADQAAARFELRTGKAAGRIGEGTWAPNDRVTCATFQTLSKRLQDGDPKALALIESAEGVIVDEGHVLPAGSFAFVMNRARRAYYRIAMSGTPLDRGDQRSILTIGMTGPVIYRIRPEVLIAAGVLSRPRIRMIRVVQEPTANTWSEVYRQCVVDSPIRNAAVLSAIKRAAKPCLVFVKDIDHGRTLAKLVSRAGIACDFVWGSNSSEERKASIKRLIRGDHEALIASVIFNEGVDIPELRSVVIASGGKSTIAALQRIGRGMRVKKDATGNVVKDEFEVYDFQDEGDRWLQRHTRARVAAYMREGFETIVEGGAQLVLPATRESSSA